MFNAVTHHIWDLYDREITDTLPLDAFQVDYRYDPALVAQKLKEVRPLMVEYVCDLARRISERESVKSLKRPRRKEKLPSVMDDLDGDDLR